MRGLHALLKAADPDGGLELEHREGGTGNVDEWLASAGTAPFLSERRIVVVRHLLRAAPEDTPDLGPKLGALPSTALLVLVADEGGSDERKTARDRAKWDKAIRAAKGFVEEFKVDPKNLRANLKAEVVRAGKKISDRAVDTLLEMTGESSSRALEEMEKVLLYVGDAESVSERDVQTVVLPSRDWNVYKMVDAALGGEVGAAMRQLRVLLGATSKPEEAAFQFVLPTLARQLRLAWQARLCIEAGASPEDPPEAVAALFPANPNLGKLSPWQQRQAMSLGRRTSFDQLARAFQAASDADARLKGLLPGFNANETLERMVLEIAAIVGTKARA